MLSYAHLVPTLSFFRELFCRNFKHDCDCLVEMILSPHTYIDARRQAPAHFLRYLVRDHQSLLGC